MFRELYFNYHIKLQKAGLNSVPDYDFISLVMIKPALSICKLERRLSMALLLLSAQILTAVQYILIVSMFKLVSAAKLYTRGCRMSQ